MEDIFPQVVFTIFGIPVRDTVISTWVMIVLVVGVVLWLRRAVPEALVVLMEFLTGMISDIVQSPSVERFVPFLGSLAIFIAVANIIGVVPMVQTPTKDINTPLALALVVFFAVHVFGVLEQGVGGYLKSLLTPLLPLDLIGQVSRTMSLTLRLFGNIISGEIVVGVIFSLVKPIAPLPMILLLGLFTGVLQAYIFTVLATGYVAAVAKSPEDVAEEVTEPTIDAISEA